jgi:hypothetical protein
LAKDIIVRKDEGIVTLVHDEAGLTVKSLIVLSDGLFARSDDGLFFIGHLTPAIREDMDHCDRAFVVLMSEETDDDHRVIRTTKARLEKER